MKTKRYYIAYGSNLNVEQMEWRCPGAAPIGWCKLEGWRLAFKGSKTGSYLTIEKAEGHDLPVVVWEISKANEVSLDRYEGWPIFYYKKAFKLELELFDGSKQKMQAFAYIMAEDHPYGIPSEYYIKTCAYGYDEFGFDLEYLKEAFIYSYEKTTGGNE